MAKKTRPVILTVFILIIFSARAIADTIVLKSGRVIEGTIIEETDDLVAVEIDGKTGFFSKEDIKSINKTRLDVARGRIEEAQGAIEVLPKGETEWKAATKGTGLNEGDSIRTGADSKAVATFANQVIMAIEQDSEVELAKLQQSRRRGMDMKVNLDRGQLWNDVGSLRSRQSKFYVETPQAVTGVRGTVFTIRITPEAVTNVAVVKGTVGVRTRGMMMTPVNIQENTMTGVVENQAPTKAVAISEEFLAQWKEYEGRFRWLRIGMFGARLGLSPFQSMILALSIVIVLMVVIVFFLRRRRRSA